MGRDARRQTRPDDDFLHLAIDPEGAQGHFPRALIGLRQGAAQWLE